MRHVRCVPGVVNAMIGHARRDAPRECCGLLVGKGDDVVEAVATRNLAESADRFVIAPHDHIAAMRAARERGLNVVGFYHSHTHSPALPSERDLAEATYAGYLYAIVSLAAAEAHIKMFMLSDGRFEDVSSVY
jgi:proteasome lid subunit RPN8/RPN11